MGSFSSQKKEEEEEDAVSQSLFLPLQEEGKVEAKVSWLRARCFLPPRRRKRRCHHHPPPACVLVGGSQRGCKEKRSRF